jgi:anti-anti-sigma factor
VGRVHRAFNLKTERKNNTLIVKVTGDIDGSSASTMAAYLEEVPDRYERIVIDSSRIDKVHPFGQEVLDRAIRRLSRKGRRLRLTREFFSRRRGENNESGKNAPRKASTD